MRIAISTCRKCYLEAKREVSMGYKVAASPAGVPLSGQCLCVTWKRPSWEWTPCAWPAAHGQCFGSHCPLGSGPRATNHMTARGNLLAQRAPPGASQILVWGKPGKSSQEDLHISPECALQGCLLIEPFRARILFQLPFIICLYSCLSNHVHLCLS